MFYQGKRSQLFLKIGLTAAITLQPLVLGTVNVTAAEQQRKMSQEDALTWAKKWIDIPRDYRLEDANYRDEMNWSAGKPVWRLGWVNDKDSRLSVTIDGTSGLLLSLYRDDAEPEKSRKQELTKEEIISKAEAFLKRVAPAEEMKQLSGANEYPAALTAIRYMDADQQAVAYTRMVDGIPFLENGYSFVVGSNGEIIRFEREWYEDSLPAAKPAIDEKQAAEKLEQSVNPSLAYESTRDLDNNLAELGRYRLIYRYEDQDPQMIDAATGNVINKLGEPVTQPDEPKPLGSGTVDISKYHALINKEQAQKIAEALIKRLPGSYRSDGSSGGGSSSGPDGIESRRWHFDFIPLDSKKTTEVEPTVLSIDDHGRLKEYQLREDIDFHENLREPLAQTIPWEQAKGSATKLVTLLFGDQLGEIYLADHEPTADEMKRIKEKTGYYGIRFGWMKDGIPIRNHDLEVTVDAKTGEAVALDADRDDFQASVFDDAKQIVDVKQAVKVERGKKKPLLSYYLSERGRYDEPDTTKPMLVYRYVGDDGVVDATSGEWLSFAEMNNNAKATDIENLQTREALQYTINQELFKVVDGNVEPQRVVTRGEMAAIIARIENQYPIGDRHHFFDDEDKKPIVLADVAPTHPQYLAIQKCMELGILAKKGNKFAPDQPLTRLEAAESAVMLLGYEDILEKENIFSNSYRDVDQDNVPAVSLAKGLELFPSITGNAFEPNHQMTREDVAVLLHQLHKINQDKE